MTELRRTHYCTAAGQAHKVIAVVRWQALATAVDQLICCVLMHMHTPSLASANLKLQVAVGGTYTTQVRNAQALHMHTTANHLGCAHHGLLHPLAHPTVIHFTLPDASKTNVRKGASPMPHH